MRSAISIKKRLVVGNVVSISVILMVSFLALYFVTKHYLYEEFYQSLDRELEVIGSLVEYEADGAIFTEWQEQGQEEPFGFNKESESVGVWRMDGSVINVAGMELGFQEDFVDGAEKVVRLKNGQILIGKVKKRWVYLVAEEGGEKGSDASATNAVPNEVEVWCAYGRVDSVRPLLKEMQVFLLITCLACLFVSSLLLYWTTLGCLKPLDELKENIGLLRSHELQRVETSREVVELKPLHDALNGLIVQLDDGMMREKKLSQNIAHELKTPLAGMLALWDVTLNKVREKEDYISAGENTVKAVEEMTVLVQNILLLTKYENGSAQPDLQSVKMTELVESCWSVYAPSAEARGVKIELELTENVEITSDPDLLKIILNNVFDNLVSYADEGSVARVELDENAELLVSNISSGVTDDLAKHVFEPMWRQSEARTDIGVHAGLGMTLAKNVAGVLGWEISADVVGGRVEVRLVRS